MSVCVCVCVCVWKVRPSSLLYIDPFIVHKPSLMQQIQPSHIEHPPPHKHLTTVNPEYFVCFLFSYISYAAAFVRNFHAYECDAATSFALKISGCSKISCVRKVGGPQHMKIWCAEIFWIYSISPSYKLCHDNHPLQTPGSVNRPLAQ